MSAAPAIPHVVTFLTQRLSMLSATPVTSDQVTSGQIISAQHILVASLMLASVPSTITIPASPSLLPSAPLVAASIGARIPWPVWRVALGIEEIHLDYGPDYIKVRHGEGPKKELWSEGSGVPISSYVRGRARVGVQTNSGQPTNSALCAILDSAHARKAAAAPICIRLPTLPSLSPSGSSWSPSPSSSSSATPPPPSASVSSSSSSESDSDCSDWYFADSSRCTSPLTTPPQSKFAPVALPDAAPSAIAGTGKAVETCRPPVARVRSIPMDVRSRTNGRSDATSGCTDPPATPPQSKFLPAAAPTVAAGTEKGVGTYRPPHVRVQSMRGPMDRPSTESQAVARPRTTAAPTPGARSQSKPTTLPSSASVPLPVPKVTDRSKNDTTAYLYQGGITLVLSGGVMLGLKRE